MTRKLPIYQPPKQALTLVFQRKKVLILGGLFKGGNLEDLIKTIEVRVHTVVLIGQSAEFFYRLLRGRVPCIRANCMTSAVGVASPLLLMGKWFYYRQLVVA